MTGLLTFVNSDNYGALLQAYALQTALARLGAESEFLDFESTRETEMKKDLSKLPPVLRRKIEETMEHHHKRSALFAEFRRENLKLSEPLHDVNPEFLNNRYEKFIVGSDQVWNAEITGGNPIYSLYFAEAQKRFSYAASFGGEKGVSLAGDPFWKEISCFNRVSLRERAGMDTVEKKTGKKPDVSADPTLLLSGDEWLHFIENEPFDGKKYVLLFLIEYDPEFSKHAGEWAAQHGMELVTVCASYIPQYGYDSYSGVGVKKWLRLIRDASCVFCDSFHATVFSILFEKNFMTKISKTKLAARSSRLAEFLESLQLSANAMNEGINYSAVKNRISGKANEGYSYLTEII